jgi:acetyl-CoA synthetase
MFFRIENRDVWKNKTLKFKLSVPVLSVRALMRFPSEPLASMDLSSLRVLGSVGEPINPQAWRWLYGTVGGGRCSVVDTYWQTETGAHLATNLPGTGAACIG